ncbi:protein phosphatase-like protein 2c [Cucurbitaria berberidis CBS 394.84]|uniref:Protein phosphatase 2C homolog 2 n=1 Tax=Cucurbitaria berberidis CBS 394.84 TaxID=1168544 RepID=A0A9P4LBM7_9PLEO|nr:protein phosphatase-like protein 2c [Cucurbitaria berberidis CBS 394.84]KAF1849771.1 protein phosphatase-like protein 2c [Cucurbitaria berberidis CBS 394.84]
MGQTLSEPVVDKHSENGQGESLIFGVSSMQGWRISMEDAHATVLDLTAEDGKPTPADKRLAFFGVYDGHGGDKVAIYTGEKLHQIVTKQEAFKEGDLKKALQDGFLATDRAILSDPKYEEEVSGCTASVGIISKDKIYVANAGDSRSVLGVKGRAKPLSFDHKPQNEAEKARIQAAGGFVDFGRVNGNLALSRAIGDFEFKKSADLPPEQQIVTAFPDVEIHDINQDDEFLVVACDGIWDCQSSQAVIEFVRRGIVAKQDLSSICENMMDNCLASNSDTGGVGCDNMTMVIIGLLQGRTKDQWYEDIAKRVANGEGPCAPPEYAEFRGPGVHHRIDDSPDDIDMDLDHRFRPNSGLGGRVILLGDGTEISSDAHEADMFDNADEDKDLESQVNKYNKEAQVTESPSSVQTEKSDAPEPASKAPQADKKPEASKAQTSEK